MPNHTTTRSSHLKDLFLLFAVPIGIAIIAALIVYVPRFLAHPTYDFIYSTCNDYSCKDSYTVDKDGHVTTQYNTLDLDYYRGTVSLRYYDASRDSTRGITLEEAKRYKLDTSSKSPDGYTLAQANEGGSGFLFWRDYDDGWYLQDGAKKRKVDLATNSMSVTFLGWVTK